MRNPANVQYSATTIKQINLVYGKAHRNEAAIRLMVDAVFLDVLSSVKEESGQYDGVKGKGKRPSTEISPSRKSLHMALETNIAYVLPTCIEGKVAERLTRGRMDYTFWYGNPKEAETNLVVVETKQRSDLAGGRWQAVSYLGKKLPESASMLDANQLYQRLSSTLATKLGGPRPPYMGSQLTARTGTLFAWMHRGM